VSLMDGLQNPLDRLEELEIITMGQGLAMENMSDQLKTQSEFLQQMTDNMAQLAKAFHHMSLMNQSLQQQCQNLHHRITVLELKKETK